tara:strand:- start:77 stop:517 length:441 start_codon:yes stop_codon:yes gene_type:complete
MAKINYNWNRVKRGDIISFRYKNSQGRILRRTVLVLEPKLRNKAKKKTSDNLIHGIQLEVSNRPTNIELLKILNGAGKVELVDKDKNIFRVDLEGQTKNIYNRLKSLVKKYGIFRTYSYEQARTSQVFLEDLRLPQDFVKELIGEN